MLNPVNGKKVILRYVKISFVLPFFINFEKTTMI